MHAVPGASYALRVAETSGTWTTIVDVAETTMENVEIF